MDQVCAYGQIPVFLTFDGDDMYVDELTPPCSIPMIIVDLKAGKNTRRILSDLNAYFPSTDGKVGENVRYALGSKNRELLLKAREAINAGNSEKIGMLMCEAQDVFDRFVAPACLEELTAPRLHQVLSFPKIQHLVWGGKGVGSQGDGSAQFVAKSKQEREEAIEILKKLDVECLKLDIKNSNG
jgi:galactokinase